MQADYEQVAALALKLANKLTAATGRVVEKDVSFDVSLAGKASAACTGMCHDRLLVIYLPAKLLSLLEGTAEVRYNRRFFCWVGRTGRPSVTFCQDNCSNRRTG